MIDEEVVVVVDAASAVVTVAVSTVERQVTWPVSVLQQTVEEVVVEDLEVIEDLEVTGPAITVARQVTSLGTVLSPVKVELVAEEVAAVVPVITVAVKDTCPVNALTDALEDLEAHEEEEAVVVVVTATTVAMMGTLLEIVKLQDRKEEVVVVVAEETATATDVDNQAMSEMTVLLMKARSRSLSHLYLYSPSLSKLYQKIRVFCLVTVILLNFIPMYEFN